MSAVITVERVSKKPRIAEEKAQSERSQDLSDERVIVPDIHEVQNDSVLWNQIPLFFINAFSAVFFTLKCIIY